MKQGALESLLGHFWGTRDKQRSDSYQLWSLVQDENSGLRGERTVCAILGLQVHPHNSCDQKIIGMRI